MLVYLCDGCALTILCSFTKIEVADLTFYLPQLQCADREPAIPSADPAAPSAWQGHQWSANCWSHWYDFTRRIPMDKVGNGFAALKVGLPCWPSGYGVPLEDPGFESRLHQDFSGVESYQWLKNWHSSGYPARRPALSQRWDWSARCQYTVIGWDGKFGMQLLSQCGTLSFWFVQGYLWTLSLFFLNF